MMDLETIMDKVSKLINKADHPNTGEAEAALFRGKAESLMRQYRIEEEQLMAQNESAIVPVLREFTVTDKMDGEFWREYVDLFMAVASHCGVRVHFSYRDLKGHFTSSIYAHVVGYSSDIRFAEFLFSAARLVFSSKLEPKPDPSLSDQENVFNMRQSGMARNRVAELLWGHWNHSNSAKVSTLYKRECAARGINPAVSGRNVNAKTYREVYAREFVRELRYRLSRARDAADSYGGAMQLHGRQERIDEVFYSHYPDYRPKPSTPPSDEDKKRSKRKSKAVKPYKPSKAAMARMDRYYSSPAARAGTVAGREAAQDVTLARSPARKDRVEGSAGDSLALGSE